MVRMDKINDSTWSYMIVDDAVNPPQILASGRLLAKSEEECLQNIVDLFKLMGTSLIKKGTAPSVEVYDAHNDIKVYGDLSPDLQRIDDTSTEKELDKQIVANVGGTA